MRIKRQQLLTAAQIARESMERNRVPGLAMALLCDGEPVQMETLGLADPARNRPVTMRTHFEAASLTKPAFAYLVFRLVDAGVLALDVPLREYWPEGLPTEDPRFASATAAHVLSHATGLPNWGPLPLPLSFAPGTGFQYSGSGYTFLQQVVERRTGRRLDDLMQAEMLDPFGMEDAALIWTRPLNRTLAATWRAGAAAQQRAPYGRPGTQRGVFPLCHDCGLSKVPGTAACGARVCRAGAGGAQPCRAWRNMGARLGAL